LDNSFLFFESLRVFFSGFQEKMPLLSLLSNFLIAFSPLLAVLFYIRRKPHLILLALASGCVYMLAILIISFLYWIPGVGTSAIGLISVSTIIQELSRISMFFGFRILDPILIELHTPSQQPENLNGNQRNGSSEVAPSNNTSPSPEDTLKVDHDLAIGFGFSTLASMLQFISPLGQSVSPAHLSCTACIESLSVFFIAALITSIMSMLHILWTYIMFESTRRKQWFWALLCVILHWCMTFTTTLLDSTTLGNFGCFVTLGILLGSLILHFVFSLWYFKMGKKLKVD
jgi:hypothetical protein